MIKTGKKVVLIGCGAVGSSFLYAAVNQGMAQHYVLIDAFPNAAEGNAIDINDARAVLPKTFGTIKAGDYNECSDADVIVITAGRPQKDGETRLDMVADNARIMKEIATNIKNSGFKGVTIIASNPVDVLAKVYQEVTGFDEHRVMGSGTTLDSARLRRLIAEKWDCSPKSVNAYLFGEHGDSSVAIWSAANVMGKSFDQYVKEGKLSEQEFTEFKEEATMMAYKIIEKKRATFYGIGACLAALATAVLSDEKSVWMISAQLNGEYNNKGLYTGVPAVLSADGWDRIVEMDITDEEQALFDKSCEKLHESLSIALQAIK